MKKIELPSVEPQAQECTGKLEVPSKEEQVILAAMKAAKERVREIKQRLETLKEGGPGAHDAEVGRLEGELERLRAEWERLEAERDKAARERMILLGHAEP